MSLTLMEGSINAVKNYLDTNMAAKLDLLDAEYADSITLDDIKTYYLAETLAIPELPAIYVLGDRTEIEADGPTHVKGAHYISVAILVGDASNEVLRKRLYRYMRAVVELLRAARSDATFENAGLVFDTVEFSPMYGTPDAFIQDARVEFHLTKIETE